MPRTWRFLAHDPSRVRQLSSDLRVSPLVAQVLIARGLGEQADEFLNARLTGLHDPELLPGVADAADRVVSAIRSQRRITIYGDYDVDGVTATALLWHCIKLAGGRVDFYIPSRLEEGYGLNCDALRQLHAGRPATAPDQRRLRNWEHRRSGPRPRARVGADRHRPSPDRGRLAGRLLLGSPAASRHELSVRRAVRRRRRLEARLGSLPAAGRRQKGLAPDAWFPDGRGRTCRDRHDRGRRPASRRKSTPRQVRPEESHRAGNARSEGPAERGPVGRTLDDRFRPDRLCPGSANQCRRTPRPGAARRRIADDGEHGPGGRLGELLGPIEQEPPDRRTADLQRGARIDGEPSGMARRTGRRPALRRLASRGHRHRRQPRGRALWAARDPDRCQLAGGHRPGLRPQSWWIRPARRLIGLRNTPRLLRRTPGRRGTQDRHRSDRGVSPRLLPLRPGKPRSRLRGRPTCGSMRKSGYATSRRTP